MNDLKFSTLINSTLDFLMLKVSFNGNKIWNFHNRVYFRDRKINIINN